MKKLYMLVLFVGFAGFLSAQNAAITACKTTAEETVTIEFDLSLNCPTAPGSLAGMSEIGFHSGGNQWAAVVAWDAPTATRGVNNGSDVFSLTVKPIDYYGVAFADLASIYFVFNQGPADSANPWASEGKDADINGDGNCDDFFVIPAELAECTNSTIDVELTSSFVVTPNPMTDRTVVSFSNEDNNAYNVFVTSLTGQVVRAYNNVTGTNLEIERGNLSAGMYFVTFRGETGKIATTKLVVR